MPTKPFTRLVEADRKTMSHWLRQQNADRSQWPLADRLEDLLWTWPIRLNFSTKEPKSLWRRSGDDEGSGPRKNLIMTRLTDLARTLYSNRIYPDPIYFDNPGDGFVKEGPSKFTAADCREICDLLRALPGIAVPDPHNDERWLLMLLEHGWGDGRVDERRDGQHSVVSGCSEPICQKICAIGEKARDTAYCQTRTGRSLAAEREIKQKLKEFKLWLKSSRNHNSFVDAHLSNFYPESALKHIRALSAFHDAFKVVVANQGAVNNYLNAYFKAVLNDPGRDHYQKAGKVPRPWVHDARRSLKKLKLSELQQDDLLRAWGLMSFPNLP